MDANGTMQTQGTDTLNYSAVSADLSNVAGAIVWWTLTGETSGARLATAWDAARLNMELLPQLPSAETAIRRAVGEQRAARLLARPLDTRGGWALVREDPTPDGRLAHTCEATVTLAADDSLAWRGETPPIMRAAVDAAFLRSRMNYATTDISGWLVRRTLAADAVRLKEHGGVYFIPRHALAKWRAEMAALRQASAHRVCEVPALPADETVAAVLDAVQTEAEAAALAMEEELANGDMGKRALRNRAEECDDARAKLARYETLLGRGLDGVRERLDRLAADLAAAALAASTDAA